MDCSWQRHLVLFRLLASLTCEWQNEGPNRTTDSVCYWWKVFRLTNIRDVECGSNTHSLLLCHLFVYLKTPNNLRQWREHLSWCKSLWSEISILTQLWKPRPAASLLRWWITFNNRIFRYAVWNKQPESPEIISDVQHLLVPLNYWPILRNVHTSKHIFNWQNVCIWVTGL